MNGEFALLTLKKRKETLNNEFQGLGDAPNVEKTKTRIKHDMADLDFAIELLEEYQD